jgi:hypothetical protein
MSSLTTVSPTRKTGVERFHVAGRATVFSVIEFWQWSASDLASNATRGILAEYIVARALDVNTPTRTEWDAWDLETADGVKVEVKSAAYLQTWRQSQLSTISFGIQPTFGLTAEGKQISETRIRHADAYVFCLLRHTDKATLDPLDLDQWEFYVVATRLLDDEFPNQKSLALGRLQQLGIVPVAFDAIRAAVEWAAQ